MLLKKEREMVVKYRKNSLDLILSKEAGAISV